MTHYTFLSSSLDEERTLIDAYVASMTGVNDDFWEEHILESQMWRIALHGETIGFFGIHGGENLTCFHTPRAWLRHAQPAFQQMLAELQPRYAYVPTRDEPFLSLAMDAHTLVEKQAYFFMPGDAAVRPPEYGRNLLALATPQDEADILDTEGVAENIHLGKYYVLRENGVFLGQGFFNRNQLVPGSASIGMSVHPDHRQKGVGRSIIMHLAELCREQGITPVCGCWYYNHNSKRTLESAGFVTQTRLLKVWFAQPTGEA